MKHPASLELFGYWNALRRGRAAPERGDVDPAAIRSILAETLMIEVERDNGGFTFPIRLSGSRVGALFGAELRGRSLPSLWRLQDRREVSTLIASVMDATQPAVAGCLAAPAGERPLNAELLLLPLRHKGRTHARLLGALSIDAVPSWLGLKPVAPITLQSHRMVDTQPVQGFAGFAASSARRSAGQRFGRFVIYDGGLA